MKNGIDIFKLIDADKVPGVCPVCFGALQYNPRTGRAGQWAHIIPKTKPNYKKHGKEIIDSRFNGLVVCSLGCNNAVQVSPKSWPILVDQIVEIIKEKMR